MNKFFRNLLVTSSITAITIYIWNSTAPSALANNLTWYSFLFFIVTTALLHKVYERATQKSPQVFIRVFMASTAIKLLVYLVFIVVFLLSHPPGGKIFVVHFLILYLIFTSFEVVQLYKGDLKQPKK